MTSAERHLTQDEIDDLLIGVAGPEQRAHCAACVPCWNRVAALSESIDGYSRATLAWSEARSNTFTRDLSGHKPAWRVTGSAMRSVAATLILGVVASLTAGTHAWPAHFRGAALEAFGCNQTPRGGRATRLRICVPSRLPGTMRCWRPLTRS